MLDFARLQSQLRRAVCARISSGQLSGSRLASMTEFRQPHIANFLHGKRGLSLEGMDRVMRALGLSVLDLIPERELEQFVHAGSDTEYEAVPLVEASALHLPVPSPSAIKERIKLKRTFLNRFPRDTIGRRDHWLRFVLFKISDHDANALYPRIPPRSLLLVDRHYNALRPHRQGDVGIYVIRKKHAILIRTAIVDGHEVLLRSERGNVPDDFLPIDPARRYAESILGRVCHVSYEI